MVGTLLIFATALLTSLIGSVIIDPNVRRDGWY